MADFLIWTHSADEGSLVLGEIDGFEKTYRLNDEEPLLKAWPEQVAFRQHIDYPGNSLLLDSLWNSDQVEVVSKRLKEFVAPNVTHVEWLPVRITNTQNRVLSQDYFILHAIDSVDAIDRKKSVFKMSSLTKTNIDKFKKLVINDSQIPSDRLIFRQKGFGEITFVEKKLAEQISHEKFSGINWLEISEYPGI